MNHRGFGRRTFLAGGLAALWLPRPGLAQDNVFTLRLQAGAVARTNALVHVPVSLPDSLASAPVAVLEEGGRTHSGQLAPAGMGAAPGRVLSFVLPKLEAGAVLDLKVTVIREPFQADASFAWDEGGTLSFGRRPVLQYMSERYDDSSPAARERTYKVFHHLFDPQGRRRVTKGPGGQYPHHRGIYYGFNKVTYGDGKTCDVWHCTKDAHQAHEEVLERSAGPVFGRHRVRVGWHGQGKELFAREDRELLAWCTPAGTFVDFASTLVPVLGPVKLDGDPQHAGFHFRADNEVSEKTSKLTWYVRPDGIGKPGETRNWPGNKDHVNLPWNAMSFVLGDDRYTVAMLDRPDNPKEARFSERPYGRFGSYFARTIEAGQSLTVRYRLWLSVGERTPGAIAAASADYLSPVEGRRA